MARGSLPPTLCRCPECALSTARRAKRTSTSSELRCLSALGALVCLRWGGATRRATWMTMLTRGLWMHLYWRSSIARHLPTLVRSPSGLQRGCGNEFVLVLASFLSFPSYASPFFKASGYTEVYKGVHCAQMQSAQLGRGCISSRKARPRGRRWRRGRRDGTRNREENTVAPGGQDC